MSIKNLAKKIKNKGRNKAKIIAKKSFNKSFSFYSKPYVNMISDGDNIILDFKKDFINPNFFIEIKHRKTGKRLERKIESNQVIFSLNELLEMENKGLFDLYVSIKGKLCHKKRIIYLQKNQFFKAVSKEKNRILKSYSTKHGNLSLKLDEGDFDYNITCLNLNNDNKLVVKGDFEILNNNIVNIDDVMIIGKNRRDSNTNKFKMDFNKIYEDKYIFEGVIDEIILPHEKILNLRIDFQIRIYEGDIYYQNLIDLSSYKIFKNDEDRFLIKVSSDDNVYSYYATQNKHSFALWITTENSWIKSYTIAKGRTIYNKYSKEKLNENMIFFESFFGKSYSGNPKYIYETMLEMGMDKKYTFVWAYSGNNKDIIPGNHIIVDRNEARDYYKYLAQAKYWVNNIIFPIHNKRSENIYLQTWHGTPLKKLGFDIDISGPEVDSRQNFYSESRNWDYLISSNVYSTEIFKRAFKFDKEILELGYPINDIFFKDNDIFIKNLKSKLDIPLNKKIILYAPTWKDDEQNESWEHYFNLEIDLKRFFDEFNEKYVILLKMHHLISEKLKIDDEIKNFVIDLSSYDDIQELYIISDILITDYSSVFFDYAYSRKPILFFVPDLNHYIENVRGLYLNMEKDLPGPLIKSNDELVDAIKNIDLIVTEYNDKYDEFYNKFCSLCTGESAKEIIKRVF